MSSPGENHDSDTFTAATLITAVTTVRVRAARRFPVISWRWTHAAGLRTAESAARDRRDMPAATMMAALYPPAGTSGTYAGQRRVRRRGPGGVPALVRRLRGKQLVIIPFAR